ncbi:MAG: DNA-3-methyladenine glycosylase 2 family protein [Bacteroidota bacterium]
MIQLNLFATSKVMEIEKGLVHICKVDPAFKRVAELAGKIDLPLPLEPYESLMDNVVSQQLSIKAAATIMARVRLAHENEITPSKTISLSDQLLRDAGLSRQKASYIKCIAQAFMAKPKFGEHLYSLDNEQVISALTEIKGVGVWTAQMFLMFTLLREDVFPVGDLGIRKGMERFFFNGEKQDNSTLEKRAEIWSPFRSVASVALWKAQV